MARFEINTIRVAPVTPEYWDRFVSLFGENGACGGCWCMYWRSSAADFKAGKGDGNRERMRKLVTSGKIPGLLAYDGEKAVGWISVGPRDEFDYLSRSRILRSVDDQPVWSISCLYIHKDYRRRGLSSRLIRAAVEFAKRSGAHIVEGYPTDTGPSKSADAFVWTGLTPAYIKEGFEEAARRSDKRPIMRKIIPQKKASG